MRGSSKMDWREFCHQTKNRPVELVKHFYWTSPVFLKLGWLSKHPGCLLKAQIPLVHFRLKESDSWGSDQGSMISAWSAMWSMHDQPRDHCIFSHVIISADKNKPWSCSSGRLHTECQLLPSGPRPKKSWHVLTGAENPQESTFPCL